MKLEHYLASRSEQIENCLNNLIPESQVPYQILHEAARYSLLGGGKRLRPILALATLEVFGGDFSKAIKAVCALELIHTYSLIHDDLPCMDNDDFRRGKPSLHKAFKEGYAVLAGDFLLTYAFDILAHLDLSADIKIKLISILSRHSGDNGMIGGQVMDLEAEGKNLSLKELKQVHQFKTGALIKASIHFGAVLAEASKDEIEALDQFGEHLGLAFQIVDDILDVTSPKKKHGKEISSDAVNQKATYVTLLGLQKAQELADEAFNESVKHLKKIPRDINLLYELSHVALNRKM